MISAPGCDGVGTLVQTSAKREDLVALCGTYGLREGAQVVTCTDRWYDKANQRSLRLLVIDLIHYLI